MLAAANPARFNPILVDTKGLGKPPPLKNTESEFVSWARHTENFVVSVHPGARDVLTWAVEKESATVAEANAATEVVMPPDTLRMLADQLYTVLMTLVEGESFDILVGSGSGEGLEAWRRLHKRWDPLTTGRARGLLREILSPGRAKLVELQGAVERLEDLMRRHTQRRDARNGQRHTLAEDIRMATVCLCLFLATHGIGGTLWKFKFLFGVQNNNVRFVKFVRRNVVNYLFLACSSDCIVLSTFAHT